MGRERGKVGLARGGLMAREVRVVRSEGREGFGRRSER